MAMVSTGATAPFAPALRAYYHWMYAYRRTWRGSVSSTVLIPVLQLVALGYGLGQLIDDSGVARPAGVDYVAYLAPGLLAAAAMQTGTDESTWPVLGAMKWIRTYHAMLASPLGIRDILAGHVLWAATRLAQGATIFLLVMTAFGLVERPAALLAVPAAVLIGLAFVGPVMAVAARAENDAPFPLIYRFVVIPMFLFSGTFFPVTSLPRALEVLAWCTPLWHGVSLVRDLVLGTGGAADHLLHAGFLTTWVLLGLALADRAFHSRLSD